jgi:hypothetical protein
MRSLAFLKVDFEIIGIVFRECFCFTFAKDIRELMVFLWNTGEVNQVFSWGCGFARECFLHKIELETLRARKTASTWECCHLYHGNGGRRRVRNAWGWWLGSA